MAIKSAWVFPGQGSQRIGMGLDLVKIPAAKAKFKLAEEILGWSVLEVCQSNETMLSRTFYTQPCIYVVSSILADLMKQQGHQPDFVAGYSMGEYIALYAAGVYDFESGLRLIKRRAELMDKAPSGMMAVLIGCDRALLEQQIQQTPNVELASDNLDQLVISGSPAAVALVLSQVEAKRVVPLKLSGAFHSAFMATAAFAFQQALDSIEFQTAEIPVLSNVEPLPAVDATVLKERLGQQMTGAVRWREITLQLAAEGVKRVVEIGSTQVLTNLIKRAELHDNVSARLGFALANITSESELYSFGCQRVDKPLVCF
ncbi:MULTISPECIES: ACP S-malonyltransferase [Cyanophyceae]|uniref:ACP S-malonyltransferase n=1 Tax=Cyanophyceae TaxID=3028117 RepID=UPI0016845DF5|nr:ACP S-malonyltransferase [Trichocoleus sp. FACHB-69]